MLFKQQPKKSYKVQTVDNQPFLVESAWRAQEARAVREVFFD